VHIIIMIMRIDIMIMIYECCLLLLAHEDLDYDSEDEIYQKYI